MTLHTIRTVTPDGWEERHFYDAESKSPFLVERHSEAGDDVRHEVSVYAGETLLVTKVVEGRK